jgi:dehydrodolichyl diphosphate syntase complex subunit NUS1
MPLRSHDLQKYRQDVRSKGAVLGDQGRGNLVQKYLSLPPRESDTTTTMESHKSPTKSSRLGHKKRLRPFLRQKFHFLVYCLVQLIYGIIIRFYHGWHAVSDRIVAIMHHHHRSPEYIQRDVKDLSRLPEHLSVILRFHADEEGALESLMDEVAELAAWSSAAGIPLLSIYEKSGILKSYVPALQDLVNQKLASYFGPAPAAPSSKIYTPNQSTSSSPNPVSNGNNATSQNGQRHQQQHHLNILLLSAIDGRATLVDLTRTLTEMAQTHKIRPSDITSDLINTEISATTAIPNGGSSSAERQTAPPSPMPKKEVGAGEPDLVLIFGPYVKLDGYPPWQVRLSEIFCVGGDPSAVKVPVEYQGFLRGLWKFAGAEMRFGR